MLNLQGKHIHLRALEPSDLDFLYELENNTDIWEISGTTTPYSKHVLKLLSRNCSPELPGAPTNCCKCKTYAGFDFYIRRSPTFVTAIQNMFF